MPPQASALCRRRRKRRKESSQTRLDHLVCFCKALQTTGQLVEKFSYCYCNDCFLNAVEKKTKTVEDDDEMEGEEEAKATSHSEEQIINGDEDEGGEEEGETENEDQPELPSGLTGMVLLSALSSVSGCYTM